jgi:hypothetical protein
MIFPPLFRRFSPSKQLIILKARRGFVKEKIERLPFLWYSAGSQKSIAGNSPPEGI